MNAKWPIIALEDILIERQETPDPAMLLSGEIPILSKIRFDTGRIELRESVETNTKMILIRPGDLVMSGINAVKGAIAIFDKTEKSPIAATIHYCAYQPVEEKVDIHFLWWLLRSKTFRDALLEAVPGGIKTELKAKRLLPVKIPLPPISEQWKIVKKIENLAMKLRDLYKIIQQTNERIQLIIRSCLKEIIPNSKPMTTLGEFLTNPPRNGWSVRCDNNENGTAVLSLGAITGFQYNNIEYKRTSVPIPLDAHYWLKNGDILITRSNTTELVGHAAIYNGNPSPCIYPDLMMRLDINTEYIERRFLWYWLQSELVREYIIKNAKGTSPTMKKISQGIVMSIPFPISLSITEQRNIVAFLDKVQANIDAFKKLRLETEIELKALMPAILYRAFRGNL